MKRLNESIETQRKHMENMIKENSRKRKMEKVGLKDSEEMEQKKLKEENFIEKQLRLYSNISNFQEGSKSTLEFKNITLKDNLLFGTYKNQIYAIGFNKEEEKIFNTSCSSCKDEVFWCFHVCGLLIAYSKMLSNNQQILEFDEWKKKIKKCPRHLLTEALITTSIKNLEFLHLFNQILDEMIEKEENDENEAITEQDLPLQEMSYQVFKFY